MELQVLVHGVDVVKDVPGNARDDAHQPGVVQVSLETRTRHRHLQNIGTSLFPEHYWDPLGRLEHPLEGPTKDPKWVLLGTL